MPSWFYAFVGRVVIHLGGRVVLQIAWWRYSRQIKLAGAAFLGAVLFGGWLAARREPPEG